MCAANIVFLKSMCNDKKSHSVNLWKSLKTYSTYCAREFPLSFKDFTFTLYTLDLFTFNIYWYTVQHHISVAREGGGGGNCPPQ